MSNTTKSRGRPGAQPEMKRREVIKVYVNLEEAVQIRREATRRGTTESDMGRQAMLAMSRK